jgi:hypothetical protein
MRLQHAMEKIWCETNSAAARRHNQRVDAVVLVSTIARDVNSIFGDRADRGLKRQMMSSVTTG